MEITNGELYQNSSLNFVLWREAGCCCRVAEFLLQTFLNKLKASNTLLNSTFYTLARKEFLSSHA